MSGVAPAPYKWQFFNDTGAVLSGGFIDVYLAGTLTRSDTWQDRDQNTLNTNPIVLDAAGRASIVLDTSKTYKFVLKTSAGVALYTEDNIVGAAGVSVLADALDDIESARVDAMAEIDAALAETIIARDEAQAARDALKPLAYAYNTAFCMDATIDTLSEAVTVKIGDAVTQSSLDSYFSAQWLAAAMRVLSDGTVGWSTHNLITQSSSLGNAVYSATGITKTTGYQGPSGAADAALFTTTATPAFVSALVSGTKIATFVDGYFLCAWKVYYDGTHRWAYIRVDSPSTKRVYFDLQNGVLGTADSGLTGGISRYDADGVLLATGWYMIYAYQAIGATSFNSEIGLSDADASPAVTVGKALRVANPQVCYGVKPVTYVPTTTLAVYGAPYSWENGGRSLMLYGGATYNALYSEDLTNAAWTSTNITAALTSTGISGEPCSQLTATAANATCLQVTVSAGTTQTFQPYIRRKTGTGAISITMNNGSTWTDITSLINSTTYTRVYLHGILANPTVGFKIATSGDVIEVCHANNTKSTYVSPPLAVHGAAITMTNISIVNQTIPVTLTGSNVLAYYDSNLLKDTSILSPTTWSGFSMNGSVSSNSVLVNKTLTINDGTTSTYELYGANSVGERIEVTLYLAGTSGGNYCSMNGEPAGINYVRSVTGLNRFVIGGNGVEMQFIRKLLIAPTTLADRDLVRTKHYQQGVRNGLYACSIVAGDHEFASLSGGTDMNRAPTVEVLKDYGDSVLLGVFWQARGLVPYDTEGPARLMQRNFVYDKDENSLVPVTNASIFYQPTRWSSNLGDAQPVTAIRLTSGANAGRIIALFSVLDSVSGTRVGDHTNVYIATNDLEGDPSGWSAATKLFDATVLSSAFILTSPGGDYLILPPTHPTAPNRIVTTFYADGNRIGSMYSDNFGSTWSLGTTITNASPGYTETTLTMWPDGTLITTIRGNSGTGNNRRWAKSVNGGLTWVDQGTIPSIVDTDSSASTVQLDPSGLTGTQGRIALSHSTVSAPGRSAFQIGYATDSTMQLFTNLQPVNQRRYFGYSGLRSLFGGEYLACAVEYGSVSSNLDNSVCLMVIKP